MKFWGKRILFTLGISGMIFLGYFLSEPQILIGNLSLINPYYDYFRVFDFEGFLVRYLILIFILNAVFLILLTIYYKYKKRQEETVEKKYEKIIAKKIINQLVFNENATDFISSLKSYLKRERTAVILIDVLRRIHSSIKGELRCEIRKMAIELGFEKCIPTYLHSPEIKDKVLAMKVISEFRFEGYFSQINKLTSSRNYVLRTEAYNALIRLNELKDLSFLKNYKGIVSLWDLNTVLTIAREFNPDDFDYSSLINSELPRVSALGISMAAEYGKSEYKEIIREKLGSPDEVLNFEAYKAFLSMMDNMADFKLIMQKYKAENIKIKKLILTCFNNCPNKEIAADFLMTVIEKESLVLKTIAMRLLLEIDARKVQFYRNSDIDEISLAHKEAVDLYITN